MWLRLLRRIWRERPDIRNLSQELILIGLPLYVDIFPRMIWACIGQSSVHTRVFDLLCSPLLHSLQAKWRAVKYNRLARGSLWGAFALKVYLCGIVLSLAMADATVEVIDYLLAD